MRSLKFLDLCKNRLRNLPNELSQCPALTDLYLSENRITSLPESIGQLTALSTLKLDSNLIRRLPVSIGKYVTRSLLLVRLGTCSNRLSFAKSVVAVRARALQEQHRRAAQHNRSLASPLHA